MDRNSVVHRLFGVVLFIGCCSYQLAAGLPNLYSVYANKKGGGSEEKPILAMANSPRCLYNGKPVENGYKVPNTEPCLNCTCNDGVLLCYLQTCPTLVVPSKDCHVGRAEGNCCPQVRCKNANFPHRYLMWNNKPHLPYYKYAADELGEKPAANDSKDSDNTDHLFVGSNHNAQYSDQFYNRFRRTSKTPQLTTLSDFSTTIKRRPQPQIQVLHHQETNFASGVPSQFDGVQNETFGDCYSKGFKYSEGMAMLSSSKCEYCYCIGGQQMCVRPKCHLNIGGCTAKYQSGFTCCPSHYECEVPADGNDNNFASIENTIRVPAEVKVSSCKVDGKEYKVGVAVASKGHCQTCYCTQVGIVCRRIECSPAVDGCKAIIPDGHCCPTEYECDDAASNRTKIPVSHSTDNYDVMVIAPSDSFTTEEDYVPEADEEINDSKYESSESTTPKDRITIEVDQDSTVHSVSIIPEDKLAVLVLTTEKDSEEKLHAISMETKNQDTTITGHSTTTSQSGFEPSSPYSTDRVSSTESTDTDTSTSYGRQTDLTPPETNDRHSTMTTAKQQDQTYTSDKDLHSTIGSATIAVDGDYYYDDYYPSDDYYPVEKEPNEVEVAARETFSPFSDYGTSDSNKKISTTLEHQEITNPRIVESTTTMFQNEQTPSTRKETNPSYDYATKDYSKSNTGTLSYDESSNPGTDKDHVYAKFESTSTIKEDHLPSTYQTYTSFTSGNQPSETTYKSETQNTLEVGPTTSTPKRTTYTALSTQTIPSTVTEVNTGDSTYIQENKEELTSESKERTQEEEGDINTYLSTNTDEGYWTVTTDQTENSVYPQKTSTGTIPIEVAELILAITKSQSEKTDVTQPENTAYTETEPTTWDNTQPSIKVNEEFSQSLALAAPKLIIERTTTKEDGVPEMTPPVPLTTDANLFKYKSPLVIFSNHGPSAPIRPLSSVQTGIPAEVNNHKVVSNPSTFRQKPQRPTAATNQTPSTTAIEFSNHRPTNTLRRPPMNKGQPRPGMVVKIGVQKPSIVRPSDGSYKTHRIVSESDDRDNNSSELQKGVDKENKLLKENDFKSLETHHLLEKPVSVSLTVDDHVNDHSVKPQLDEGHSHIPMESVSTISNILPFTDGANKEHHRESTLLSPGEEEESQQNSEIPKDIYENEEVTKFIANAETTSSYVYQSTPKSKTEYQSSEDGKLSRADDELHVEDLDSPFVDRRLTSYGVGPLQRVPETKLKPHDFSTPEKLHNTEEETVQEIADVCFVDGRYYKSGEIIVKSNPCELCRCFYGYPLCQLQQCPDPPNPSCMLEYLPGYCCPRVTCGVRDDVKDEARPPIGPTQEQIPQTASDNQWRPLPNAYPQGTHNSKRGEEATGVNAIRNKDESNSSELLKTHVPPPSNVKEIATSHIIKVSEIPDPLREVGMKERITLSSLAIPSPTEPNPVFNPKQKKDNSSSIHDNSSGVRKILDESVVLPASKVSLSPVNSSDIKTVLPLIHAAPTSAPDVRPISVSPTAIASDDAKSGISSEFGGNLKISGCNVYGEYYKINDKVSVLSKPCSECVCSADGISCTETC